MALYPRKLLPLEGTKVPVFDKYLEVLISPSESDIERHYVSEIETLKSKQLEDRGVPPAVTEVPSAEWSKKRKSLASVASERRSRSGKTSFSARKFSHHEHGQEQTDGVAKEKTEATRKLKSTTASLKPVKRKASTSSRKSRDSTSSKDAAKLQEFTTEAGLAQNILEAMYNRETLKDKKNSDLSSQDTDYLEDFRRSGTKDDHIIDATAEEFPIFLAESTGEVSEVDQKAKAEADFPKTKPEYSSDSMGEEKSLVDKKGRKSSKGKKLDFSVALEDDKPKERWGEDDALLKGRRSSRVKKKTPEPQTEAEGNTSSTYLPKAILKALPLTDSEAWVRASLMKRRATKVGLKPEGIDARKKSVKRLSQDLAEEKAETLPDARKKSVKRLSQDLAGEKEEKLQNVREKSVKMLSHDLAGEKEEKLQNAREKSIKRLSHDLAGEKLQNAVPKPDRRDFEKARALMQQKADAKADNWLKDLMETGRRISTLPPEKPQTDGMKPKPEIPPSLSSEDMSEFSSSTDKLENTLMEHGQPISGSTAPRRKSSPDDLTRSQRPEVAESQGMNAQFNLDRQKLQEMNAQFYLDKQKLQEMNAQFNLDRQQLQEMNAQFNLDRQQLQEMNAKFTMDRQKSQEMNAQFYLDRQKSEEMNAQFNLDRQKSQEMNEQFNLDKKKLQEMNDQLNLDRQKLQERNVQFNLDRQKLQEMNAQINLVRQKLQEMNAQFNLDRQKLQEMSEQFNIDRQKSQEMIEQFNLERQKLQEMIAQFNLNKQNDQDKKDQGAKEDTDHKTSRDLPALKTLKPMTKEESHETLTTFTLISRSPAPPKCARADPQTLVRNYMRNKEVSELFQYMTIQLLINTPENPLDYLIDLVRRINTSQTLSGTR